MFCQLVVMLKHVLIRPVLPKPIHNSVSRSMHDLSLPEDTNDICCNRR